MEEVERALTAAANEYFKTAPPDADPTSFFAQHFSRQSVPASFQSSETAFVKLEQAISTALGSVLREGRDDDPVRDLANRLLQSAGPQQQEEQEQEEEVQEQEQAREEQERNDEQEQAQDAECADDDSDSSAKDEQDAYDDPFGDFGLEDTVYQLAQSSGADPGTAESAPSCKMELRLGELPPEARRS